MSAATVATQQRDFQFFVDIIDAFKASAASAKNDHLRQMKIDPFLEAMTIFLRIFDAFSNPFFSDVVKKDVVGNINVSHISDRPYESSLHC